MTQPLNRRRLLLLGLALPVPAIVAACGGSNPVPAPISTAARSPDIAPTSTAITGAGTPQGAAASPGPAPAGAAISCNGVPTPSQTEGPYFKAGSPERTNLIETGVQGIRLTLRGYVLDRSCRQLANVKLDFWQADGAGNYDNSGYRLRGHQFTDAQGRYTLETVIPGLYPGRTEHIHFKAQAPGKPELTSQLYFPGVAQNRSDGIFDAALVIDLEDGANGARLGTYNIVLNV